MPLEVKREEPIYLWDCLHDGSLEKLSSDRMARTLTIVIDSPFHWDFHHLPKETRFQLVGVNVQIAESFTFEPWPGSVEPPREMPWEAAQKIREDNRKKGRLISSDWNTFVESLGSQENYEILEAELISGDSTSVLELGVMSYPNSAWHTLKIHAEQFRFYIGDRELSLEAFEEFGSKYWQAFASRTRPEDTQKKSE